MYKIDSSTAKPSADWLYNRVKSMMNQGIKVNNSGISKLFAILQNEQEKFAQDIKVKYHILNPNSSAQIISYMNDLNDSVVVEVCFQNGKWTSNQSALQQLADIGYEFAADILGYRKAKKYADSLKAIRDARDNNGFIHPSVSLTKTNRVSYSNPPLMGIPKKLLWDTLEPSKPGNIFISADIKNQEPNILINMQNIQSLKPALTSSMGLYEYIYNSIPIIGKLNLIVTNGEEPGVMDNSSMSQRPEIPAILYTPLVAPLPDIYINGEAVKLLDVVNFVVPIGTMPDFPKTAKVMTVDGNIYETPIEVDFDLTKASNKKKLNTMGIITLDIRFTELHATCSKESRKEFKRAWNAMSYGASVIGVQRMCHILDGKFIYDFFANIPELKKYRAECTRLASNRVQQIRTYFGSVLTANEPNPKALKRVLLDLPIQGTAADILSLLVKHFDDQTRADNVADKIWVAFTRHDELIIEVDRLLVEVWGIDRVMSYIRELVEHQVDSWEPFKLDITQMVPTDENELSSLAEEIFSGLKSEEY